MFAQSIKEAKRPRVVMTLETKFKITADYEAEKRTVNIGSEMKKVRIQPTLDSSLKKTDDSQPSTSALKVSSIKFLKC
jgi:hypothetical protein